MHIQRFLFPGASTIHYVSRSVGVGGGTYTREHVRQHNMWTDYIIEGGSSNVVSWLRLVLYSVNKVKKHMYLRLCGLVKKTL